MGLLKKLPFSRKKKTSESAAQDELVSLPGSVGSLPQNTTLKQSVLHSVAERVATHPSITRPLALGALAAQLQHSHAHGATECCCPLLSAAITAVNADPGVTPPRHDVFLLGQEITFVLQHGRECCRYTAAGLMASLTAQQASRTVLHQLYVVPALAHALSVSEVHNARPVAVALGNLALEPITHPAMLSTDGVLEGLIGILLWEPSPQELELVPADVVDACKHDALYALGSLAGSPSGAAALLEFEEVVPACLSTAATVVTSPTVRHAALQVLQRLSSCGGQGGCQQVADSDGVHILCGMVHSGCGGGCVLCARGVLGVLDSVALGAHNTQRIVEGGGIAAIMQCLCSNDGAVQRDAAAVMYRLAAHEGCKGALLSEPQLVPTLQRAMDNACDGDTMGPLLGAAAALAVHPSVNSALVTGGVVPVVVCCLREPMPSVRGAAAWLLAALASGPTAARAIVDAGALAPLVACMHSPEEGPSWAPGPGTCGAPSGALLTLRALAVEEDVVGQLLHIDGAVDGAMQLAAHARVDVALKALTLLCVLAAHTHDHRCFVRAWAFPQVLPCLEHTDPDCREQARTLVAMLASDDHAATQLVSSNVLPMVGRCLVADPHPAVRQRYLDLLGVLVLGGHAANRDAQSVLSGCSVATPTQRKVLDAGRQLAAVKGLAPALLHLLGGMLGKEGDWARIHAALEVLQSMARTHRTAVVTATSHNLHLLAQLLHGTTPDAPRFAAIKLLTALAKHKDPVVSQALVTSGLVAALVEEWRAQQALVVGGAVGGPERGPEEAEAPSSPTSGVMMSPAYEGSPASSNAEEPLPTAHDAKQESWADGTSLTSSFGRQRTASGGNGSRCHREALLMEEPPSFWQHCLLVGLYNVCLDDDACQEVFLDHGGAALLAECLTHRLEDSNLCVANFVAALAVDCTQQQVVLKAHGLEDTLCALYARSLEQQQLRNVIAVALWELWDHTAPSRLGHGVALDELLARKDDVLGQAGE